MRQPVYYEELKEIEKLPVALPKVAGPLPNTDESYSFNAANRQQKPFDLAKYGYVEYTGKRAAEFVSGLIM
ncbi:hypothetical protein [Eisenbergiella sp.]